MATSGARRPLPALAFLLALSLLTALVWWRVLHRADSSSAAADATASPSCSPSAIVTAVPAPATITVAVLNSTQRSGLAGATGQVLKADGFKIAAVGNDNTSRAPVLGVAEIRYGPAGAAAATLLSYYVPGATFVPDGRATASVDLALGAKFTAVAAPAVVAKALAAAHLTQLPAPAKTAARSATPTRTPTSPAPTTTSGSSRPSTTTHPSTTPAPATC